MRGSVGGGGEEIRRKGRKDRERLEESGSEDERRGRGEKRAGGRKKRHRVNDEGI